MSEQPIGYRSEFGTLCMECGDGTCQPISAQILSNELKLNVALVCRGCGRDLNKFYLEAQ